MTSDITDILKKWPYDDTIRIIRGDDGKEKLQKRIPLGIMQLEMDRKPDGTKYNGKDSALEYHLDAVERHKNICSDKYIISPGECSDLIEEYKHINIRYAFLFSRNDFKRIARDTEHNLKISDMIYAYAQNKKDRLSLEMHRPSVVKINSLSGIMLHLKEEDYGKAASACKDSFKKIGDYAIPPYETGSQDYILFMKNREEALLMLNKLSSDINKKLEENRINILKENLRKAVEEQRFEKAAELRDMIKQRGGNSRL